jgi:hypothetical protein
MAEMSGNGQGCRTIAVVSTRSAAIIVASGITAIVATIHISGGSTLKGQGSAAPLGRLDYVIQDAMIGGFALLAVRADAGPVMTAIALYH